MNVFLFFPLILFLYMGRFWKSAPIVSPHRRQKGHQVPFAGIDLFSQPKARHGLVDDDRFFILFKGSDLMKSREPWEAIWSRFSKPWGPIAVHTAPYFFPIERFLRLKEPQKWAVQSFSSQTVRSGLGFKTSH